MEGRLLSVVICVVEIGNESGVKALVNASFLRVEGGGRLALGFSVSQFLSLLAMVGGIACEGFLEPAAGAGRAENLHTAGFKCLVVADVALSLLLVSEASESEGGDVEGDGFGLSHMRGSYEGEEVLFQREGVVSTAFSEAAM